MRRLRYGLPALALAMGLFLAGALGPWRSASEDEAVQVPARDAPLTAPFVAGGDLEQTIAALQAHLEETPDDAISWSRLGLAYLQRARQSADPTYYGRSEDSFAKALEVDPDGTFETFIGLGTLALGRHDFREALHRGRAALALNEFSPEAHGVIGDAQLELGRYDDAERTFQAMVDLKPNLASYSRVSYLRELYGDIQGAIDAMELALQAAGTPEDAAWAANQLGELHFNKGDLESAQKFYEMSAARAPEFPEAQTGLAKVEAARGDTEDAIARLDEVVERYPDPGVVILLGDLLAADGRRAEAEERYDLADAIDVLYASNEANTDLESALFAADRGVHLTDALERIRGEYASRESIHVADALAWTLYANGDYRSAEKFSERARSLGTHSALFEFHAGMIALELGERERARVFLTRALDINPYFSFRYDQIARRALESLR